jgi:hypothetical protein
MLKHRRVVGVCALAIASLLLPLLPSASAAQSLAEVQARVRQLEEEATTAAEGAQEAKVTLASLTRTLVGIQAKAAVQGQSVDALSRSLSTIAVEQYKNSGLGQGLELLFSSDPTLFLDAAGSLEAITRRKSIALKKYKAAKQRLNLPWHKRGNSSEYPADQVLH